MNILNKILAKIKNLMKNDKENRQKSEKEILEEKLNSLLIQEKNSVVVSIKGSWGIGKSYFWHNFSKRLAKKPRPQNLWVAMGIGRSPTS